MLVAAVNPGSNTVSLFGIDPVMPSTLTAVGVPMSSGGEFPVSIAFNTDGSMLCALNAGQMDGVQCYDVNATMGLTTMSNTRRLLNIGQTTPPQGPLGTASQVAFSQDGTQVYAAVKGNPDTNTTGYIAAWNMTASGLSDQFTRVEFPMGAVAPFSMTPLPGMNGMFSADAGVGIDVFDFSNGVENTLSSPRTRSFSIPQQMATCWSAYSNMTGNFYTSDLLASTVSEINLDMNNNLMPSLVNQYPIFSGGATLDLNIATVNSQDYLYLLMPNITAVEVIRLDGPGNVTSLQQMDIAGPAGALNLAVNPAYLVGMTSYVKPAPAAAR
jgi:DNA-binding beta-propeller fold protein YncE